MAGVDPQAAGSLGASLASQTPAGLAANAVGAALSDAPTSQTSSATGARDQRTNWAFSSGDFIINSRTKDTSTATGDRATRQDAGGSSSGGESGGGLPSWLGWAAAGVVAVVGLVIVLVRR